MTKTAVITGVNGQDGSYLAEFLIEKGYNVVGTVRGKNPTWPYGFNPNVDKFKLVQMDLGYPEEMVQLFNTISPIDEFYNLAAQTHVGYSFNHPVQTYRVTGDAACLLMDYYFAAYPEGKFYQASSSEMFGNARSEGFISYETDGFAPASPYAVAKIMAHYGCETHRLAGHFAVDGILFNHESERRHETFVTQKICKAAVQAYRWQINGKQGEKPILHLGNTMAYRDWGYAPEYVEMMWKMMQESKAKTWTIGTGITVPVYYFLEKAFEYLSLDAEEFTAIESESFMRPYDVWYLRADPADANMLLGRMPKDVDWLVRRMVDHQLKVQGAELCV